jgi:NAD(P)-dependent dehydrogenase (short-subunit alcohol dehydrogenase family)
MELKGAVALVTGGNGGLGQRICHALAQEGAHLAIMYARSRDQAEGVASELASLYQINARAFACDITDGAAVDRLAGEVTQAFGRLDILGADASDQGGSPHHEGSGARPHRQHRFGSRPVPCRLFHRLCRIEGGAHPSDALHGGGAGARDAGQLRGTGSAGRHARDS